MRRKTQISTLMDRDGTGRKRRENAMQVRIDTSERIKDLRVEKHLTLEQLAELAELSSSAIGKYESGDYKDISAFAIAKLAEKLGVSTDYLLCLSENKNHPSTELDALHLSDDAIEVLKMGKFNHRLLSEFICHKDFRRFMLDAEIYVDRIADMRIKDMNTVLEATRQMILMEHGENADDLYLHTLQAAQIQEEEYFGHLAANDLNAILSDIRAAHKTDALTADDELSVSTVQEQLAKAVHFEGSPEEKKVRSLLAALGIDYDKLSKEQFVTLIEILKLSRHMKSPISQRGKLRAHGKGKKKRR